MLRKPSKIFFFASVLTEMLFVLSASIAIPLLVRPFYYAHISFLHLPAKTGWSAVQIRTAFDEMMDYCLFGGAFSTGDLRWSQSGMAHFADCAVLFRLDLAVLLLSALALLIFLLLRRRGLRPCTPLGLQPSFWAGSLLAGTFFTLAALAATNFDRAFVLFHALFFPGKSNWIFDPAADEIILILPQVFFRNCAILIVGALLLCCAGMIGWSLKKRSHFN